MTILPGSLDYLYYNGILDHIPYEAYEYPAIGDGIMQNPQTQAMNANMMSQDLNVPTNPYSGLANQIAPKITTGNTGAYQASPYNNLAYNANASQYLTTARQGTMYGDYEVSGDSFSRQGINGTKQYNPRGLGNNNNGYGAYPVSDINSQNNYGANYTYGDADIASYKQGIIQEGQDAKKDHANRGKIIKGLLGLGAITTAVIMIIKKFKK